MTAWWRPFQWERFNCQQVNDSLMETIPGRMLQPSASRWPSNEDRTREDISTISESTTTWWRPFQRERCTHHRVNDLLKETVLIWLTDGDHSRETVSNINGFLMATGPAALWDLTRHFKWCNNQGGNLSMAIKQTRGKKSLVGKHKCSY